MSSRIRTAWAVYRQEGPRSVAVRALGRAQQRIQPGGAPRSEIRMLVGYRDALEVDWTMTPPFASDPRPVGEPPYRTAWIMSPPGESSGGHQNLFRFIDFLEKAGHEVTVYLYHSHDHAIDADYLQRMIARSPSYPHVRARFVPYSSDEGVASDTDAIFATGWETAYPAYRDRSRARRFYFVQDFEPSFYPVGTESVLAENTYRFGFTGITAGGWLASKLAGDYGMQTAAFDFGADVSHYRPTHTRPRRGVFFYARPVTPRRGFELGVMALEHLARMRPDIEIHLAGWDVSSYDLPFPHTDWATMQVNELNDLYNRCAVGLVLSLTNLSLLPLELLAAGVIPVVNAGDNNTMVTDNPFVEYAQPTPWALARRMAEVLDREDAVAHSHSAAASVADLGWERSGRQFVALFEEAMHG